MRRLEWGILPSANRTNCQRGETTTPHRILEAEQLPNPSQFVPSTNAHSNVKNHFSNWRSNCRQIKSDSASEIAQSSKRVRNIGCRCGYEGHFLTRYGQCPNGYELLSPRALVALQSQKAKKPRKKSVIAPIAAPPVESVVSNIFATKSCSFLSYDYWRAFFTAWTSSESLPRSCKWLLKKLFLFKKYRSAAKF